MPGKPHPAVEPAFVRYYGDVWVRSVPRGYQGITDFCFRRFDDVSGARLPFEDSCRTGELARGERTPHFLSKCAVGLYLRRHGATDAVLAEAERALTRSQAKKGPSAAKKRRARRVGPRKRRTALKPSRSLRGFWSRRARRDRRRATSDARRRLEEGDPFAKGDGPR